MRMRSEHGFSLIEIMTALAITMVVLALTFKSFSDALKVDDAMKLTTEVDQNLQAASTYVVKDMVDTARNWPSGGIPLPNGTGSVAVVRPGTAADTAAGMPSPTVLSPIIPGDALGPTVGSTQTDTVTICYMDGILGSMDVTSLTQAGTTLTMVLSNAAGQPAINTRPENTIAVGDIFYINNGNIKAVQRVTALNAATRTLTFASGDSMNINQPGAAAGTAAGLVGKTDNKTQRMKMVTYFIDNSGAVPMLMRQDYNGTANGVALGITNFQVAYNATTWAGTTPTTNVTANIFADGYTINQVDQAQVALSARSDRQLRQTNRYISNDTVTQVDFRSINTKQDYSVTP
jgi:type II secretory pathway pseudopilin PulG